MKISWLERLGLIDIKHDMRSDILHLVELSRFRQLEFNEQVSIRRKTQMYVMVCRMVAGDAWPKDEAW